MTSASAHKAAAANSGLALVQWIVMSCVVAFAVEAFAGGTLESARPVAKDSMSVELVPELNEYFTDCGCTGSIAVYNLQESKLYISDSSDVIRPTLPASTFKIINLLIALEMEVISDVSDTMRWHGNMDTVRYSFRPKIYRDMTVQEAFQESAVWVFVELANKIGRDEYIKHLRENNYGSPEQIQEFPDFWNFGDFGITPLDQIEFLTNMYNYETTFSKRNVDLVKEVMITERSEEYVIHAKTGWARNSAENIGWWVGYVEMGGSVHVFATRIQRSREPDSKDFGSCRMKITMSVLKQLGAL